MNADKTALMRGMEAYFNGDARRINHAHRVTGYAEELLKWEGGDYSIGVPFLQWAEPIWKGGR